jgi:hypothetical protein
MRVTSRTWTAKTSSLAADKDVASIILRLMMAQNDISIANDGLSEWIGTTDPKKLARQSGGKLYYGRMLMSHLREAMRIIEDIHNSGKLARLIQKADAQTRKSFDAILTFLSTGDYGVLKSIRNKTGAHYDPALAAKALQQIDNEFPGHRFTYSLGNDPLDWYFELGDLVVDKIVVREIFQVPEGADVRSNIDPILLRLQKTAFAFSDFAGYFIRHTLKP